MAVSNSSQAVYTAMLAVLGGVELRMATSEGSNEGARDAKAVGREQRSVALEEQIGDWRRGNRERWDDWVGDWRTGRGSRYRRVSV